MSKISKTVCFINQVTIKSINFYIKHVPMHINEKFSKFEQNWTVITFRFEPLKSLWHNKCILELGWEKKNHVFSYPFQAPWPKNTCPHTRCLYTKYIVRFYGVIRTYRLVANQQKVPYFRRKRSPRYYKLESILNSRKHSR